MERNYTTQMDAARRGIVTPELETVAKKERMTVQELQPLVASGKVVIPANKGHACLDPETAKAREKKAECEKGKITREELGQWLGGNRT